ncbi:sensor histidine kinase [Euzebya rosea]|uniref:sensor histidine kinase n=1 Tax=Euzebya rosea TaxID=2052804 RepID=UPI000D3E7A34|nr:histidine kinase [Euzebya rosea]
MSVSTSERLARWTDRARRTPPWLQDLVLAIAVSEADLAAVLLSERTDGPFGEVSTPVAAVVVVLVALPLVFRRSNPGLTMILTGFGAGAAGAVGIPIQPLAPIVALYTVAAWSTLADTVVSTAIFLAITTSLVLSTGQLYVLYSNTLIVLGVAVLGRLIRAHREQAGELARRAHQLELEREERARLAIRTERTRIAREMHDVLAHSTSVMVVQATGAKRLVRTRPEAAEDALGVIADTGRQSLADLRRMLGLLRRDDDGVPTTPQPTLSDIPDLVAEFVDAGVPVDLRMPEGAALEGPVGLSAYRIVQEALTNVLKHADPERVIVDVRVLDGRIEVEVLDDGGAARQLDTVGGGYGLVGMRERAGLVDGTLEAGPRPGGGFRVAATLPVTTPVELGGEDAA